jgi:transcriptional regulator with XRE-family HTH domain
MARASDERRVARNLMGMLIDRDWSQTRLVRESGLAQSTVNAVCNARSMPSIRTLRRLKETRGCTWEELRD